MAEMDLDNERYSGFERFMFFLTPILFTIILLGVFLMLFNENMRNRMLEAGNSIPYLADVLPDPKTKEEPTDQQVAAETSTAKIDELRKQLNDKTSELTAAQDKAALADEQIKQLQSEIEQLTKANEEKMLDDEQYQAKITELANMYALMTPSKAAPILQSMSTDEAVLVLEAMAVDKQSKILEKMTAQKAADISISLKDVVSAKDRQIAALQGQLDRQSASSTTTTQTQSVLDTTQLQKTFASMTAKSAADLLIKMADVSPSKVLRILNAVDDSTRASILQEMSTINNGVTAQLVSKLMTGK
ncbi:flagellar motility protein MotE (MotC chaperone) [Paenibacillus cellulosilyticus]|uniref:Flagellar motility protein MotE (MotC chaperone) n=1 Tax=Paenibacillus cellulosilyticus TaxID=375489 RepID=A0A2V2YXB9_9BACL|nr:flagellar motility protein MotE (MotC chaperone) [Paenibacillus cellulosilyticus]QKS46256.1 MgtE protein [Paenibacillus cellulosilyticus]